MPAPSRAMRRRRRKLAAPAAPPRPAPAFFLPEPAAAAAPVRPAWHLAAVLVMALAAPLTMRAWFTGNQLPAGDGAGYIAQVDHVRAQLLAYGRVPYLSPDLFAGSTQFMSNLKELATLPLALAFGSVRGTELMFLLARIVAGLGMYGLFARLLRAPAVGLVAGYAYACGTPANAQVALGGHLDVAISYALLPPIFALAVELLRRRRWPWGVAVGVLCACQLGTHYVPFLVCPLIVLILLALRPWRGAPGEDPGVRALATRSAGPLAVAAVAFALFAASPLAWLAADAGHHGLHDPAELASGLERFIEQSPFMYVNRANWLGPWLDTHRPPRMPFDANDPRWGERRYLGLVALAVAAGGWWCARRRRALRRWYQAFALVLLFQYWMAMGPRSLVWQLGQAFGWPPAAEDTLRAALTTGALACLGWGMVMLWRGAVDERGRVRRELAFGLALVLFVPVHSLFDMIRALGFLRSMRSPGHFFDLAPFAFYALFGTGLVAIAATVRGTRVRRGLLAAVATLVVLDFWPSMRAFEEGVEPGPVRELEQILTALPGEGGTLRVAMYPWFSPSDWTAPSLALAHAEAGAGWSWLYWQAGPHWARYLRSATLPFVREVDPEKRERFRPVADVLARVARLKYVLDEKDDPPALVMEAPWKLRAENAAYALWEQPEVMPMASGYRTYALAFGAADTEVTVYHAAGQNVAVLSGGDRLADTAASLIDGAALVVVKRGEALAGAASEALARRYGDKIVEIGEWPARLGRLPRAESVAATYRRPAPERVVLETDAGAAPAVVFLSESYHPWWKATVDGAPAPVVRAETALMAVPVGPGRHVIELRLARPVPVVVADWLTTSACALLPVAAAAYAIDRARRPRLPRAGGEA